MFENRIKSNEILACPSNSSNSETIVKNIRYMTIEDVGAGNKRLKLTPDITINFGNCKICEEKSSGIHYGISTCEGCKVNKEIFFYPPLDF